MTTTTKNVDDYISKKEDFAKPILNHLRKLIHIACPQVEEKIKWGMPFFDYKGEMMCHIAAFKQHAVMSFWKAALMKDAVLLENAKAETAMGHLGKITSLKDLPPDKKITAWIKEAMQLNDAGIKIKKPPAKKASTIDIPDYFLNSVKKNKKAWAVFQKFPPSHVKEYVEWITEAKREETRNSRIQKAITMMEEGKDRNWKYR